MTYALSASLALLVLAVGGLIDQWLRKRAIIAYLAMRKVPLPTDEEWAKCYRLVLRMIFRRRRK